MANLSPHRVRQRHWVTGAAVGTGIAILVLALVFVGADRVPALMSAMQWLVAVPPMGWPPIGRASAPWQAAIFLVWWSGAGALFGFCLGGGAMSRGLAVALALVLVVGHWQTVRLLERQMAGVGTATARILTLPFR